MSYNFVKSNKPSKHLPISMEVPLTIPMYNNVSNVGYSNMIGSNYKPGMFTHYAKSGSTVYDDSMATNYFSKMTYQNNFVLPEKQDNNNKCVWKNNLGEQLCNCIDNDNVSKIHNNSHMEQIIEDSKEANMDELHNNMNLFNSVFLSHNHGKSCIMKDKLSKVNTQVVNNETVYTYRGKFGGEFPEHMIKNIILSYSFDLIYKIKAIGVIYLNTIHDEHKISMDGNHLRWELLMNNENIYMGISPEDRVFKFPIDFLFPNSVITKLSHGQTIDFFIETTHNMGDEIKMYYNMIEPSISPTYMSLSMRNIQAVTIPFQNKITLKLEGLTQYLLFYITPSLNTMGGVQLNRCVMKDYNKNIIFDYTGYEMSKIIPTMMFPRCKSPSWPQYYVAYFGDTFRNPIKAISSVYCMGFYNSQGESIAINSVHINNKVTNFEFEGINIETITIYNCTIGRCDIMIMADDYSSMNDTTFAKMSNVPNISKEIQIMEDDDNEDDFVIDQIEGVDELVL